MRYTFARPRAAHSDLRLESCSSALSNCSWVASHYCGMCNVMCHPRGLIEQHTVLTTADDVTLAPSHRIISFHFYLTLWFDAFIIVAFLWHLIGWSKFTTLLIFFAYILTYNVRRPVMGIWKKWSSLSSVVFWKSYKHFAFSSGSKKGSVEGPSLSFLSPGSRHQLSVAALLCQVEPGGKDKGGWVRVSPGDLHKSH